MSVKWRSQLFVVVFTVMVTGSNFVLGLWVWQVESTPLIILLRQHYALVSMWLPAFFALGLMVIGRDSWRGVIRWRLGHWSMWLEAYCVPCLLVVVIIMLGMLTGEITGHITDFPLIGWRDIHGWFVIDVPTDPDLNPFLWRVVVASTVGLIPFLVHALGEELGWRGYMLHQLKRSDWRYALWWGGLIWSQWHLPFLLRTPDQSDFEFLLWFVRFTVSLTLLGVWIGHVYWRSGSIFVAMMAHASHNLFLTLGAVSVNDPQGWLLQDSTWVLLGYVIVLLVTYRRHTGDRVEGFVEIERNP